MAYYDPFPPPAPPDRGLFARLRRFFDGWSSLRRWLESAGLLSIIVAAAQYVFTYGDRIAERQVKDWDILRQVQLAQLNRGMDTWKGNLGVVDAMERLTQDCMSLLPWPKYDCVGLASLKLEETDLGGARLNGAVLARGTFRCSNLSGAQLKKADLTQTYLGGASLMGADLSGANFNNPTYGGAHKNPFYFTTLSGAKLNDDTDVDPNLLKCGCIIDGEKPIVTGEKFKAIVDDLVACPRVDNLCGEILGNDEIENKALAASIRRPAYMVSRYNPKNPHCAADAW